jgi:hypothetical protein
MNLTPKTHCFTITSVLPTLNEFILAERTNRFAGAKMKKTATRVCHYSAIHLKGKVDKSLKYDVEFEWNLPDMRKDPDNVASMGCKCIFDGLVSAKVLADDGAKNIGNISHKFLYGGKYFVVVTLKPSLCQP